MKGKECSMSTESTVIIRDAVEFNSPYSIDGILERIFSLWFNHFVYNQIWEDPKVDVAALEIDSKSRILTIASGGCNVLNYLNMRPRHIYAVDVNRNQLQFARLKLTALRYLPDYESFLNFYGYADKQLNIENYYNFLRSHLDREARQFWEYRSRLKKPKILYFHRNVYRYGLMGYFIRVLHWFACNLGPDPAQLLSISCPKEREEFFESKYAPIFRHWSIKFLGRFPFFLYCLGIPPQQFREVKKDCNGSLSELYFERIKRLICTFPIENNYFAWQALDCRYNCEDQESLPDYLQQANYDKIKAHADNVSYHLQSTTNFLKTKPANSINRYVFLDSMDWMNNDAIAELWAEVARTGQPASRIIFRTGSRVSPVEKALPESLMNRFQYEEERSKELHEQDRSALYGGFHLYIFRN
jgi:S-adenosylmethionine-diacylglycerol 3-amino-3-carboxypropyl transferase